MRPKVVPLSGSMPIKGTGMNGAVAGSNHRHKPVGGEAGGGIGPGAGGWVRGAGPFVGASGGGAAHDAVASSAARNGRQLDKFPRGSARQRPESSMGLP